MRERETDRVVLGPRQIGDTRIDCAFTGLASEGYGLAWVHLSAPNGLHSAATPKDPPAAAVHPAGPTPAGALARPG